MSKFTRGLGSALSTVGRGMLADAFDAKKAERESALLMQRQQALLVLQEEMGVRSEGRAAKRADEVYTRARNDQLDDTKAANERSDRVRAEDRANAVADDERNFGQQKQLIGVQGAESRRTAAASAAAGQSAAEAAEARKWANVEKQALAAGYTPEQIAKLRADSMLGVKPQQSNDKIEFEEDPNTGMRRPGWVTSKTSDGSPIAIPYAEWEAAQRQMAAEGEERRRASAPPIPFRGAAAFNPVGGVLKQAGVIQR